MSLVVLTAKEDEVMWDTRRRKWKKERLITEGDLIMLVFGATVKRVDSLVWGRAEPGVWSSLKLHQNLPDLPSEQM